MILDEAVRPRPTFVPRSRYVVGTAILSAMTMVVSPADFQLEVSRWLGLVRHGEDVIVEPAPGEQRRVLMTLLDEPSDPIDAAIRSGWAKPPRNPNAAADGFPVLDIPTEQARAMIEEFESERDPLAY